MKPPAVPAAVARPPNTRGESGWRRRLPTVHSWGPSPAVQSAVYGAADAETNMTAAGRQAHAHMWRKTDRKRERDRNLSNLWSLFMYLRFLNSLELVSRRSESNIWMTTCFRIPSTSCQREGGKVALATVHRARGIKRSHSTSSRLQ